MLPAGTTNPWGDKFDQVVYAFADYHLKNQSAWYLESWAVSVALLLTAVVCLTYLILPRNTKLQVAMPALMGFGFAAMLMGAGGPPEGAEYEGQVIASPDDLSEVCSAFTDSSSCQGESCGAGGDGTNHPYIYYATQPLEDQSTSDTLDFCSRVLGLKHVYIVIIDPVTGERTCYDFSNHENHSYAEITVTKPCPVRRSENLGHGAKYNHPRPPHMSQEAYNKKHADLLKCYLNFMKEVSENFPYRLVGSSNCGDISNSALYGNGMYRDPRDRTNYDATGECGIAYDRDDIQVTGTIRTLFGAICPWNGDGSLKRLDFETLDKLARLHCHEFNAGDGLSYVSPEELSDRLNFYESLGRGNCSCPEGSTWNPTYEACECGGGALMDPRPDGQGGTTNECTCAAGASYVDGRCSCMDGIYTYKGSGNFSCECADGTVTGSNGACACSDPLAILDGWDDTCKCVEGASQNSGGSCQCAEGTSYSQDPYPPSCDCGSGKTFNDETQECVNCPSEPPTTWEGGECNCAGDSSGWPAYWDPKTDTCNCTTGETVFNPTTKSCEFCPEGSTWESNPEGGSSCDCSGEKKFDPIAFVCEECVGEDVEIKNGECECSDPMKDFHPRTGECECDRPAKKDPQDEEKCVCEGDFTNVTSQGKCVCEGAAEVDRKTGQCKCDGQFAKQFVEDGKKKCECEGDAQLREFPGGRKSCECPPDLVKRGSNGKLECGCRGSAKKDPATGQCKCEGDAQYEKGKGCECLSGAQYNSQTERCECKGASNPGTDPTTGKKACICSDPNADPANKTTPEAANYCSCGGGGSPKKVKQPDGSTRNECVCPKGCEYQGGQCKNTKTGAVCGVVENGSGTPTHGGGVVTY